MQHRNTYTKYKAIIGMFPWLYCDFSKVSWSLWFSVGSLHVHTLYPAGVYNEVIHVPSVDGKESYLGASTGLVERGPRESLAVMCVLHDANLDSNAYTQITNNRTYGNKSGTHPHFPEKITNHVQS